MSILVLYVLYVNIYYILYICLFDVWEVLMLFIVRKIIYQQSISYVFLKINVNNK